MKDSDCGIQNNNCIDGQCDCIGNMFVVGEPSTALNYACGKERFHSIVL